MAVPTYTQVNYRL